MIFLIFRYNTPMIVKRFAFLLLFTCLSATILQAKVYEFRNGVLQIQPGTEGQGEENIAIEDLMDTLMAYQRRLNESDQKLRKRDEQIIQLQEELTATKREMTLLKNHYFRQF